MEDKLTKFRNWYLKKSPPILVPYNHFAHFIEGVSGLTIFRNDPFQVQIFIAEPNTVIPNHTHPNVDSYEVALNGMEFFLNDEVSLSRKKTDTQNGQYSAAMYETVRVYPDCPHGGIAGKNGGSFISIQHWLNGVKPTSVANDWNGVTMGNCHTNQVLTTEVNEKGN